MKAGSVHGLSYFDEDSSWWLEVWFFGGFWVLFFFSLFLNVNGTEFKMAFIGNSAVPYSLSHNAFQLNFLNCKVKIISPDGKPSKHMQGYVGHCTATYLEMRSQ